MSKKKHKKKALFTPGYAAMVTGATALGGAGLGALGAVAGHASKEQVIRSALVGSALGIGLSASIFLLPSLAAATGAKGVATRWPHVWVQ